jgi:hypothetical protein
MLKEDVDGVERLFPCNIWITIYWGDWKRNNTPNDLSDDVISPISVWRVQQVTGGLSSVVTDDNNDGQLEINRAEEILAYIQALKGPDVYGRQVAGNPVLVKGPFVWYEDAESPNGVSSFRSNGTGIPLEWYSYIWGMDHNVLRKEEAWGYSPPGDPQAGCRDCHRPITHDSPVFARAILVDPYGLDGKRLYQTVSGMTGLNPP